MSQSDNVNLDDSNQDGQPLVEHLIELRACLLRSLVAVLVVFLGLFSFADIIHGFVAAPLEQVLVGNNTMIAIDPAAPFLTPFKMALYASIYFSVPYIIYQLWSFVAPALYVKEKRIALPLLASSVVLFYAGTAFAYFAVFPLVFQFIASVAPEGVAMMTDISSYMSFVIKLFFAFGVAFEIPIVTILLIYSGVISAEDLGKKRPYVVVSCFVLGMLMTPPDVISQLLLAFPMWILFEAGLFFGKLMIREKNKNDQDSSTSSD